MKFTKINDILVLTEKGDNVKECETVELVFSNNGSGNYVILGRGPYKKEIGYFEVSYDMESKSYKCMIPGKLISEDDVYSIRLCEKDEESTKDISKGCFLVSGTAVRSFYGLYEHELEKLWATLVYITEKLGIDEAAIDTLITGYITE